MIDLGYYYGTLLQLYECAEVIKLFRLHCDKSANGVQNLSCISGRVCGKYRQSGLHRITNQEDICGHKFLRS